MAEELRQTVGRQGVLPLVAPASQEVQELPQVLLLQVVLQLLRVRMVDVSHGGPPSTYPRDGLGAPVKGLPL